MSEPQDKTQQEDFHFESRETTYKTTHTAVRKARRFAMQGLYEWLMTDHRFGQMGQGDWRNNAPHDIAARTRATNAMHTVHLGYYHDMMRDIPAQIDALDNLIAQHLDRDIGLLDPIEHAILLIGTYELKQRLEVPYKVVLDEAMKLNTHFGATDAHKLINAVLDKLAPQLRALEVAADEKNSAKAESAQVAGSEEIADQNIHKTDSQTTNSVEDIRVDDVNVDDINNTDEKESSHESEPPKPSSKPRIGLKNKKGVMNKGVEKKGAKNRTKVATNISLPVDDSQSINNKSAKLINSDE